MKKQIIVATLSLSILLLGGTTALAKNSHSQENQNPTKIIQQQENTPQVKKAENASQSPRHIQEIGAEFTDIQNDWAREEVLEAHAKGFVTGYADFTFRPNSSVSKLETLVMIINAIGLNEEAQNYDLSDEQEALLAKIPDWGQSYIALALDKGILTAEELSSFNPQQAAKRYEVCMYMSRVLTNDDANTGSENTVFTDEDQIPATNRMQVRLMSMNGVVSGYPDGKFQPMKAVKRNEMITMLNKLDDNCMQIFSASTVKGTVKEITEIEGGYAISIETSDGKTVVVNTSTESKLIYKGHLLSTALDIESSMKVKILVDQDGGAVLVRFMGTGEGSATIDDVDDVDENQEQDKLNKNKHGKSNKPALLDEIDELDEVDELDEIGELDEIDDEIDDLDETDVLGVLDKLL